MLRLFRPKRRTGRDRLTARLLLDVCAVLDRHGYRLPDGKDDALSAMGATVANLVRLATGFEGQQYGEMPSAEELLRMGRHAALLVAKEVDDVPLVGADDRDTPEGER